MFRSELVHELESIAGLERRIYPLNAPEAVRKTRVPYLIYLGGTGLKAKTLNEGYHGTQMVRVELNVVAADYDTMTLLTEQVVELLEGMEQREIGVAKLFIQSVNYETPVEIYEQAPDLYRCQMDTIFYF
ncbi:DUF3168 domain-containing protein [Paenibacillus sp. 1011MAR3C5]|uniref:DUF3168 domain-containing protein n=1 Tax=Paenibacillus sp. 1011MAR3C5 TaxID=1675787 RepID=UPI000E6CB4C8|nr:DUF3168 domain-containing protein [Paenibacillus sp. 1011MAR3C5]RJE88624.1 DUF3168 domain-containing protein [Paenibacillus sp. 1011MAR3C5]